MTFKERLQASVERETKCARCGGEKEISRPNSRLCRNCDHGLTGGGLVDKETKFRDSLTYWREILAGAVEDEAASWKSYEDILEQSIKAGRRWKEDHRKLKELEEKVRRLEVERDHPE